MLFVQQHEVRLISEKCQKMSDELYSPLYPPSSTPDDELCHCVNRPPIKLVNLRSVGNYNPLTCIDCNCEVSPEALPLNSQLVQAIAHWNALYGSIDYLWLESGSYEIWALDQSRDINSPINQLGIALCRDLNEVFPTYYWFFQDESADDFQAWTHCPQCKQPLTDYAQGIFSQRVCEACHLIGVGI